MDQSTMATITIKLTSVPPVETKFELAVNISTLQWKAVDTRGVRVRQTLKRKHMTNNIPCSVLVSVVSVN